MDEDGLRTKQWSEGTSLDRTPCIYNITQLRQSNGLPIIEEQRNQFPLLFGSRCRGRMENNVGIQRGNDPRLACPSRFGGNLPRQSMSRNWEFYNIFGSEPVFVGPKPGAEDEEKRRGRKVEKEDCGGGLYGWDTTEGR